MPAPVAPPPRRFSDPSWLPLKSSSLPSRAQSTALAGKSEIQRLRALPLPELRALAAAQIVRARAAWEKAADTTWCSGLLGNFAGHRRWEPDAKQILLAEGSLQVGDTETHDQDRATSYIDAWMTARQAVTHLGSLAGFGESDTWYFVKGPPAQGMLDEVWFPWNVKDLVASTDADFERIHLVGKGRPAWETEYKGWKQFYARNQDPGWLSSSQETVEAVRRYQRRLKDWQEQFRKENLPVGPSVQIAEVTPLVSPPSTDAWSGLAKGALILGGLYVAAKAIERTR